MLTITFAQSMNCDDRVRGTASGSVRFATTAWLLDHVITIAPIGVGL